MNTNYHNTIVNLTLYFARKAITRATGFSTAVHPVKQPKGKAIILYIEDVAEKKDLNGNPRIISSDEYSRVVIRTGVKEHIEINANINNPDVLKTITGNIIKPLKKATKVISDYTGRTSEAEYQLVM